MIPVWILCTPRTGSSYLCELLNNLKIFPDYEYPGLSRALGQIRAKTAFGEWLRLFSDRNEFLQYCPMHQKVIHHFYYDIFKTYNNYEEINQLLPGIKYIHLRRHDTIKHAASLYFARQTNNYHIYSKQQLDIYRKREIIWDEQRIMEAYNDVNYYYNIWNEYAKNVNKIDIYYEDLINNPFEIIANIFEFLKIPIIDEQITQTIAHNCLLQMTNPNFEKFSRIIHQLNSQYII